MTDRLSQPQVYREILRAELHLANLAIAADFFDLWKTEPLPALQRFYASNYRKLAGVDPLQHDALAAGLHKIQQTGDGTVTELIATLNRTDPAPASDPASEGHVA